MLTLGFIYTRAHETAFSVALCPTYGTGKRSRLILSEYQRSARLQGVRRSFFPLKLHAACYFEMLLPVVQEHKMTV